MKLRLLLPVYAVSLALGVLISRPVPAKAQTHQVVDEIVAQVNDDVITLSKLNSESKRRVDALKKMGRTEQQATAEVAKHRDQLIATLIDELLLMQRGKELQLSEKVEAEVNQRLAERTTPASNPAQKEAEDEMRVALRTETMIRTVFEEEVDGPLFRGFEEAELRAYLAAHQEKFHRPETVTLSEIFLSFKGKDEAQVKAAATQLVAQLRAGANFAALATARSDRDEEGKHAAPKNGGKVGTFELPTLRDNIAAAIKNVKAGGVSDPLRADDGYQILRVDERTPASATAVFNQNRVREVMTAELSPKAHEEYLQHLRAEAYIQIGRNYQAAAPIR